MSEPSGMINRTGLQLKLIRNRLRFMESIQKEEMSKPMRKKFEEYLKLTREEECDIMNTLEKTGGEMV